MSTNHDRRTFLKGAAAAAATAGLPILGANDRIRVGIVGMGGRGRAHVKYLSELKDQCAIRAVCDVNQAARERAVAQVEKLTGRRPKEFRDMREMFDGTDVDAVFIATPNHWHALATIWACQAGKDVYVEKPACHNIWEGRQMVKAAREYRRIVQVGSQSRSKEHRREAIELLRQGEIGAIYMARGFGFKLRKSIGHTPDEPVPPGLDWDLFLGPAQWKPYSKNKFAYNWHWFWDTGNGDIGNQGVHEIDMCLWGLGRGGWPERVVSTGGKFVWQDDQETPNTQQAVYDFGKAQITFDARNLPTNPAPEIPVQGSNYVGNIFLGTDGHLVSDWSGYRVYKGDPPKVVKERKAEGDIWAPTEHVLNFFQAVRARDPKLLTTDVAVGVRAAAFAHLANISYRVKRTLRVARSTGRFVNDDEANALLTRNYRPPYVVPEEV